MRLNHPNLEPQRRSDLLNPVNLIRWLLTIPSAIFGFYLAFSAGLTLAGWVEEYCNSNSCSGWKVGLLGATLYIGIAIAAVLVVLLPTLLAPTQKVRVAQIFYGIGALAALVMVTFTSDPFMLLTALAVGGLTLRGLGQRFNPKAARQPDPSVPQ